MVAFASASAYLTRYCISAANTTIQNDLSFDDAQMGQLMSAFGLGYLLCQIPGGWFGNRFGTRFAFAFLSIVWSLCNIWTAAGSGFRMLWASRFFLGTFQAGLVPVSAHTVNDWIPIRARGLSSALITASMSVGGAFAMWLTGRLLDYHVGWRLIFAAYATVGIAWSVGFYWYFRTDPKEHPAVNDAELNLIEDSPTTDGDNSGNTTAVATTDTTTETDTNAATDTTAHEPQALRRAEAARTSDEPPNEQSHEASRNPFAGPSATDSDNLSDNGSGSGRRNRSLPVSMLGSAAMWGICVQSFCRAAGYAFFVTWFFAFLEYAYGINRTRAGLLNSLPLIAVVIGSLSGGIIVDRLFKTTGSRWISRTGTAIVALTACGTLTMASAWTTSATQLAAVIALGALFSGIGAPAAWAATIDIGGRHTAVVMGVMNMAGCLAGVILPAVLGTWFNQIRSTGGDWNPVIYLHAAFYFVGALSWLAVNPNREL